MTDQPSYVYAEDELRHLLAREVQRSTRYQDFLSLCLVRVSTAGPSAEIRETVARRIAEMLRSTDMVGSIGENIAVLLVHTPDTEAAVIADRIRERGPAMLTLYGEISLRIGLACFPVDGSSEDALLTCARSRLESVP